MSELEIREEIAKYLEGDFDAAVLEDHLHDLDWSEASQRGSVAGDALRLLAEYANGDWTDAELRGRLAALSQTYWLQQAPPMVSTGSDAHVIREDRRSASVERLRVAEPV